MPSIKQFVEINASGDVFHIREGVRPSKSTKEMDVTKRTDGKFHGKTYNKVKDRFELLKPLI